MFNSKWSKRVALIVVIVMAVMTLAGCQSGRTYEDVPGDASGIYVPEKEQRPEVPYTGESTVIWHKVDDPNAADISVPFGETPDGSSSGSDNSSDDTAPGTNDTTDNTTPGTNDTTDDTTPGTNDTTDDTTPGTDNSTNEDGEENVTYDSGNLLKVVSYNIRVGNDGAGFGGSSNDIKDRAPRLKKVLDNLDPDIIGFQEVNNEWYSKFLPEYFSEYDHIHKWRAESNKEGTPIFWKKDKFELLDSGHFWLSETPDAESKGWSASHYRICMWVKLKVKATGKTFLYYNTHYDFSADCHVGSANLIISKAKALGGFGSLPVFFTADCNMSRFNDGYNAMLTAFADVNMDLDDLNYKTGGGYHLDGHEGLQTGSPIDYCFYSPNLMTPLKYQIIDEKVDGGYVSDHKGLYIELAIA